MITKKTSLRTGTRMFLFMCIVVCVICCREKTSQDETNAADGSARQGDASATSPAEDPEGIMIAPIYVGSERVTKKILAIYESLGMMTPTQYNRDSMVAITVPYIKRVLRGHNAHDPDGIDASTETLLIYLDKKVLDTLLHDNSQTTGLIAIFAAEKARGNRKKHQTFILVPFDTANGGRALTMGNATGTVGYERWPTDATANVMLDQFARIPTSQLDDSVKSFYSKLGIK